MNIIQLVSPSVYPFFLNIFFQIALSKDFIMLMEQHTRTTF